MKACCPKCNTTHDVGAAIGGKVVASLVAGAIGHATTRSPWVTVLTALVGFKIGELIDREVIPRCPTCGVALQVLAAAL